MNSILKDWIQGEPGGLGDKKDGGTIKASRTQSKILIQLIKAKQTNRSFRSQGRSGGECELGFKLQRSHSGW